MANVNQFIVRRYGMLVSKEEELCVGHDDNYLDYMRDEALDDLFQQHTLEYKNDLAADALLKTAERVEVVRVVLADARKVMSVSPTAAHVFAASACEIIVKDLLFVPVLSGLIHEEFGVAVIMKLLARTNRDRIAGSLIALLKRTTFIDLSEAKRTSESVPILSEVDKIAKKRNDILHSGNRADEASAQEALAVADYLLNNTFQSLLGLNKLYMVPGDGAWVGRQWKVIVPMVSPAEEDQDPWRD